LAFSVPRMKVIYEMFGRACYKLSDNTAAALFSPKSSDYVLDLGGHIGTATRWFLEQGISGADVYEPRDIVDYDLLVQCGCFFKADSAHGDAHSGSVVIRAGGEAFYFKQVHNYQTLVMATSVSRWPLGFQVHPAAQRSPGWSFWDCARKGALGSDRFV
ncbi:Pol, partial [Symbiodinium sp. CCMP2456]